MVYFMVNVDEARGPIKIGFSMDPEDRARRLGRVLKRRLSPSAPIPGGMGVEGVLHQRFAEGRLHGEWFDYETPGLHGFISDALLFEGFWPEDKESPGILRVLDVLREADYPLPECCYTDGWM
jgi:hypothetical protein